jgi:hypothetical protein
MSTNKRIHNQQINPTNINTLRYKFTNNEIFYCQNILTDILKFFTDKELILCRGVNKFFYKSTDAIFKEKLFILFPTYAKYIQSTSDNNYFMSYLSKTKNNTKFIVKGQKINE